MDLNVRSKTEKNGQYRKFDKPAKKIGFWSGRHFCMMMTLVIYGETSNFHTIRQITAKAFNIFRRFTVQKFAT
jgi:hypothetical protein